MNLSADFRSSMAALSLTAAAIMLWGAFPSLLAYAAAYPLRRHGMRFYIDFVTAEFAIASLLIAVSVAASWPVAKQQTRALRFCSFLSALGAMVWFLCLGTLVFASAAR